tara:strand:+ start:201 stop:392 length:192 start_codon:yes stop_codon:yes gene_type:complete
MEDKYVIVLTWDSCDPMVYGLFDSYYDADKWRKNYKWDEYDKNNELSFNIEKLKGVYPHAYKK